jgi:hypothetical protein
VDHGDPPLGAVLWIVSAGEPLCRDVVTRSSMMYDLALTTASELVPGTRRRRGLGARGGYTPRGDRTRRSMRNAERVELVVRMRFWRPQPPTREARRR